jgi:hypothetical protein
VPYGARRSPPKHRRSDASPHGYNGRGSQKPILARGEQVVLDAKFMDWAAGQQLDTATLKAAKVPIFGKWYFPHIPPGVAMVNLKTGEVRSFSQPMQAGEILWAPEAELRRAGFWPPRSADELAAAKAAAPARPTAAGVRPGAAVPASPSRPAPQADAGPVQAGPELESRPASAPGADEQSGATG